MALETDTTATLPAPISARIEPDRRRHRRVALTLLGRFMRSTKQEYPCKLIDISVGGAALMSPVPVEDGETIVVYLDQLGGVEGVVVRQFPGGFALKFAATQHRREKLAAQITWLLNRHELDPTEARRHERVVPRNSASGLTFPDGTTQTSSTSRSRVPRSHRTCGPTSAPRSGWASCVAAWCAGTSRASP
jgi:hypothetical protein